MLATGGKADTSRVAAHGVLQADRVCIVITMLATRSLGPYGIHVGVWQSHHGGQYNHHAISLQPNRTMLRYHSLQQIQGKSKPCPRLIGSCLDLASPSRGRIVAALIVGCRLLGALFLFDWQLMQRSLLSSMHLTRPFQLWLLRQNLYSGLKRA